MLSTAEQLPQNMPRCAASPLRRYWNDYLEYFCEFSSMDDVCKRGNAVRRYPEVRSLDWFSVQEYGLLAHKTLIRGTSGVGRSGCAPFVRNASRSWTVIGRWWGCPGMTTQGRRASQDEYCLYTNKMPDSVFLLVS